MGSPRTLVVCLRAQGTGPAELVSPALGTIAPLYRGPAPWPRRPDHRCRRWCVDPGRQPLGARVSANARAGLL